jgi:hypothetical protein
MRGFLLLQPSYQLTAVKPLQCAPALASSDSRHEPRQSHSPTTESIGACAQPGGHGGWQRAGRQRVDEMRRALHDHELIKVKFAVGDRVAKQQIIADMCPAANANSCSKLVTSRWYTRKIRKRNSA